MKFWKFYATLAATFFVILGVVVYGPGLIDWNDHKSAFRTAVFEASGCHLSIDGDLAMDLLPTPRIVIGEVRLTEDSELGAPSIVAIKGVNAVLGLRDLFAGNIEIKRMELQEPRFLVPVGEKKLCDENAPGMTIVTGHENNKIKASADKEIKLSIKKLDIKGGSFPLKLPGKKKLVDVSGLNFQIDMLQDGARILAKGAAFANDIAFNADFSLSGMDKGRAPSVNGAFDFPELDGVLKFSGNMTQPIEDSGGLKGAFNGTVSFNAPNSKIFFDDLAPGYVIGMADFPLNFESEVQVTSKYVGLNNYSFENGPLRGNGSVNVSLEGRPTFDIVYSAKTLDFDEILKKMPLSDDNQQKILATSDQEPSVQLLTNVNGQSLVDHMNPVDMGTVLEKMVRDLNADVSLDLTIDAFKYLDGVVREAGLHITFGDGSLTLDRASAIFPGGSDISVFGFMDGIGKAPIFEGKISLQSDDFKRFLAWSGVTNEAIQASRLRSVSFQSNIQFAQNYIRLPAIDLTLDASKVSGRVGWYFDQEIPKLKMELVADKLNLDAYLSEFQSADMFFPKVISNVEAVVREDAGPLPTAKKQSKTNGHNRFDAEINLEANEVIIYGKAIKGTFLKLNILDDNLTLKHLKFDDYLTISALAKGHIDHISSNPEFDMMIEFASDNLSSALSGLEMDPSIARWAHDLGSFTGNLLINGPSNQLLVESNINAAAVAVSTKGTLAVSTKQEVNYSIEDGRYESSEIQISNMRGILSSGNEKPLQIRNFAAKSSWGRVELAQLSLTKLPDQSFALIADGKLREIPANSFLKNVGELMTLNGTADASYQITSSTRNIVDLWLNKKVEGRVSGQMAIVPSTAQTNGLQVKQIKNVQDFMGRHFGSKSYSFSGTYHVDGNMISVNDIALESPTAVVRADGTIDLGEQKSTATLSVKEKVAQKDFISINLNGPWDNLSVKTSGTWIKGAN